MWRFIRSHWQVALILLLFLGSLGFLLLTSFAVVTIPNREMEQRRLLGLAAQELAEALQEYEGTWPPPLEKKGRITDRYHRSLAALAQQVLRKYPGCEGGIYFGRQLDQFAGFVHPDSPSPPPPHRRDPPPIETPTIRLQAREALERPASEGPLIEARDIDRGRIAVATCAVGDSRPAWAAAWVMMRLNPADVQRDHLKRYQLAAGLGLGGILLSLIWTYYLGQQLRQSQRQEEQLKDELRRSEHLASFGKLLAGVAHEVRNPLAGIRSTVQLWQRLPDTARSPESLEAVLHAVDQMSNLVNRLLQFTRSGHEHRSLGSINDLLAETIELIRAQATENQVVIVPEFAADLPNLLCSPQSLRQVFMNLFLNSLQAMPRGGTIRCRTQRLAQNVAITVSDTGPGIAAEHRRTLFDPFFTTRSDGTGLGLAFCREIIEQHGGKIELVHTELPGATFRIVLPIHPAPER